MNRQRRHASLRWTLSAIISLLTVSIVTAVSTLLIESDNRVDERELQHKAALYAGFFANQLQSAVAYGDRQTANEILSSSAQLDRDLESVGVYREDGSLLEEHGENVPAPWAASPKSTQLRVSDSTLEALAPVISREGPRGTVVLRMSRAEMVRTRHAAMLYALAIGAAAVAVSLLAAWLIAGWVARRLGRIVSAADAVANGDLTRSPLDVGRPDEIGRLTLSFNTMVAQLRQLIEASRAAAALEQDRLKHLVDERTVELAARNDDLQRSHERYRLITETTSAIPWEYDIGERRFTYVGPQAVKLLGHPPAVWQNLPLLRSLVPLEDCARFERDVALALKTSKNLESELQITASDGRQMDMRCVATLNVDDQGRVRGLLLDVTGRKKLEVELQQAQKLESVGRLASGIAHEINTPIQFVGDSLHFIREAFGDLLPLLAQYRQMKEKAEPGTLPAQTLRDLEKAEEISDIDYLAKNVPQALDRCSDGLDRVAKLVRSMKEFAHPDQKEKVAADLNQALATTLSIARNEYKYVADIETSYGEIPPLLCHVSELNQAFLNIIVNSAHAISDQVQGTQKRGMIRVATRRDADHLVVAISDTGGGIPESIRSKIFDPFFTTKAVGKGTGQGLAIARSMVVDKHGGSIALDSELGRGTTFTIRLPLLETSQAA
jgi:PAS domain S-box-containing protein